MNRPRTYSKPQTLQLWSWYRLEDLGTFFRIPQEHLNKIEASLKHREPGWPGRPYEQIGEVVLVQFAVFRELYEAMKRHGVFNEKPSEAGGE